MGLKADNVTFVYDGGASTPVLRFAHDDGYNTGIYRDGAAVMFTVDGTAVGGFADEGPRVSTATAATGAVGDTAYELPIYDETGALLGYVPIYDSIENS